MPLNPLIGQTLINTGAEAVSGILGMIGQRAREERTMQHQQELMDVQFGHQRELDKYGSDLQFEMWKKTNYPAQVEMLKEAGLNPALLYSKGGPGGVTGSQTGGSAAGASAPMPQPFPMELGNAIKMGAETALLIAQKNKTVAEQKEIEGRTLEPGLFGESLKTQINEANGRIQLNLSAEALNEASTKLKESELNVNKSVIKLNEALANLDAQKLAESASQTKLNQQTLDWMEETGLNPHDSSIAKIINYLSEQTGLQEDSLIYLIGGAMGLRELMKFLPDIIFKGKKPGGILNSPEIKGFGK